MTMTTNSTETNRIARRAGEQGARLLMRHQVEVNKLATGVNPATITIKMQTNQ